MIKDILLRKLIIGGFCFLVLGCGRKFDNPLDPTRDGSTGVENSNKTDTVAPTTNSITTAGTNNNPTATGPSFNFANTFAVTIAGCISGKVKGFETDNGIRLFVNANCGERYQVYTFSTSYINDQITQSKLLTDCSTGSTGVAEFDIDKAVDSYLLVYTCRKDTTTYETRVTAVNSSGEAGIAKVFDSVTLNDTRTYKYQGKVKWNGSGNAFAFARGDKFQRFDIAANQVGGSISFSTGSGVYYAGDISVVDGNWVLVHDYRVSSNDPYNRISIISSSGVAHCSFIDSGPYYARIVDTNAALIGRSNSSAYNIFVFRDISLSTCAKTTEFTSNSQDSNNLPTITDTFNSIVFNGTYMALLFKATSLTLSLGVFSIRDNVNIHGFSSIANFTNLNNAELKVIQNRLYVFYSKDGGAFVSYSNETITQ